jgi:hypothetical protein
MTASNDQDVCITFRSRLEMGQSTFVVPVHRKFVNDRQRRFGFESITLMPEYQNTQAYAYNLDTKKELEAEWVYPIQLECLYGADFYPKDVPGKTWTYLQTQRRIDAMLTSINQHFDRHKPGSTFVPPVFLDWIHLEALNEEETLRGYTENTAMDAYGEEFSAAKHATWLPPSLAGREDLNNCIFPTADNQEYLADVRVRLWIGPNTTITFSNKNLALVMGFNEAQIPAKNKRGQVPFVNSDPFEYMCVTAWDEPKVEVPVAEVRSLKINCYTTNSMVMSGPSHFAIQKQRERDPKLLCADLSEMISALARKMNFFLNLTYNESTKNFKFVFPSNAQITVRIYMMPTLFRLLGFDPSYGECVDQNSVSVPVKTVLDTEDLQKKALALVYDTGMVAVDLYEQSSHLSSHSGTTLMATLHPLEDGTLQNRIYFNDVPRVHVSHANPNLKFVLYRFDDYNRRSELGWPVGAYVFGTLTGKV